MNLEEATCKALEGKLIEENINEENQIIDEIFEVVERFDDDNYELRYKGFDAKINGTELKMYYQTQEDIDKEDIKIICNEIIPEIKKCLKEYPNNVSIINITFYDRSGRYEDGSLKKSYKVIPPTKSRSSNSKIIEVTDELLEDVYRHISGYSIDEVRKTLESNETFEDFVKDCESTYIHSHYGRLLNNDWVAECLDCEGYTSKRERKPIYAKIWAIWSQNRWNDLENLNKIRGYKG